jgi:hypothetical protein
MKSADCRFPNAKRFKQAHRKMVLGVSSRPNLVLIWNRTAGVLFHIGTTSCRKFLR